LRKASVCRSNAVSVKIGAKPELSAGIIAAVTAIWPSPLPNTRS
jgi:hypothetical protein